MTFIFDFITIFASSFISWYKLYHQPMIISVLYMHVDGTFAHYVWIFTIFSLYNLWKLIEHLLQEN